MNSPRPWYEQPRIFALLFGLCVAVGVMPIWVALHQPSVDVPEHLFLIHVLQRLGQGDAFYAAEYVSKPGLTYVTFYYSVKMLGSIIGLENAMRVWLTIVLAGIPLSIAYLLRVFGRSPWLALLAIPLIYTYNFYWGLISFLSSLPLTFLAIAFFVQVLEEQWKRIGPLVGLALSLALLQLTHAAGMIFPAVALPLLLATTPFDWGRAKRAVIGVVPGVALFLAWLIVGVGKGRRMGAPNEPWKASAPLLDARNFVFSPLRVKGREFWDYLADGFWFWADRPPLYAVTALAVLTLFAMIVWGKRAPRTVASMRPLFLFALAVAYFVFLPSDITGYMYQIYPRYAQVAALLAIPVLSLPKPRLVPVFIALGAAVALFSGLTLSKLFKQFDQEAQTFEPVAAAIEPKSKIMHLIVDKGSAVSAMPVYLHYTPLASLRRDGFPSFSLAIDPSFPVGYRDGLPPAPASEWRPEQFSWSQHASHYDYFLFRGRGSTASLFREHAGDVDLVTQSGKWSLFRKRTPAE